MAADSVEIVFLGRLADLAGSEAIHAPAPLDWAGLIAAIGPQLARELEEPRVHCALDGALVTERSSLFAKAGSQVALLPPVSGG